MTKVVIPPPGQPFVADEKVNEPWRRHLDVTNQAVNSASQLINSIEFATTTSTGSSFNIPQGWRALRMDFMGLTFTSTAGSLCVSISTDSGTSFINSGYRWVRFTADDSTFSRANSTGDTKFQIETGFSTGVGAYGDAKIISASSGNPRILFRLNSQGTQTTSLLAFTDGGGRVNVAGGRMNAVLVHTTAGTFAGGHVHFYGDR